MPHSSTAVILTGPDTITCSAPFAENRAELYAVGRLLVDQEKKAGAKVSPFKRGPYRGYTTPGAAWAVARGRVLVELRGATAHEWWAATLPLADKVSRLDLEVTVRQQPYDHDMALRLYLGDRENARQRGRPAKFRLEGESDGGSTLYIGKGASRYQARLYEAGYKHPKQGMDEAWRYEVQTRRERAQQVADLLSGAKDAPSFVQAAVHKHFVRRGVDPIFDPSIDVEIAPLPKAETDSERSLRWLGAAVAPALERHREWGTYEEAKHAIGLK